MRVAGVSEGQGVALRRRALERRRGLRSAHRHAAASAAPGPTARLRAPLRRVDAGVGGGARAGRLPPAP